MEQKMKHRLAWLALAFAVVIVLLMSGCAMFEEQMANMKGLVGVGSDPIVVETPPCDLSCVEDIAG
jgi:hypothetical protein